MSLHILSINVEYFRYLGICNPHNSKATSLQSSSANQQIFCNGFCPLASACADLDLLLRMVPPPMNHIAFSE